MMSQPLAGRCVFDDLTLFDDWNPVHQHIANALGILVGFGVGGPFLDGGGVKHSDVSVCAHLQPPLSFHAGHGPLEPAGR